MPNDELYEAVYQRRYDDEDKEDAVRADRVQPASVVWHGV